MDALCVSVIPNYWTLPFKSSLRCISHFCLSDWWRAGSDSGPLCVLKKCLTSHAVFTSDTIHCSGRSRSAAFLHRNFSSFVFILVFRYQTCRFPALGSVMARCKEKLDYTFCIWKKIKKIKRERRNVQSYKKIHHREKILWREVALWYWAVQMNRIATLGASSRSLLKLIAVINSWDKCFRADKIWNAQKNWTWVLLEAKNFIFFGIAFYK